MKVTTFTVFIDKVRDGSKRQTVRPVPKRPQDWPKVGEVRSLRRWTGKPYRSAQEEIRQVRVVAVDHVDITAGDIVAVNSIAEPPEDFAKEDGFDNADDFFLWFDRTHGLPFEGIVFRWEPLPLTPTTHPAPDPVSPMTNRNP